MNSSFITCVFRQRTLKGVFTGLPAFITGYSSVARIRSSTAVHPTSVSPSELSIQDLLSKLTSKAKVHQCVAAGRRPGYSGQKGDDALVDVLLAKESSCGKPPNSFPKSLEQLPPYKDYSMKARTCRQVTTEPRSRRAG